MMNDVRRRIAGKLREKFDLIESSLLHPDGSEPNWSVEELFEVLDIDYPECLNPWECPYDYIADLIDVPTCKDLVEHVPDPFIPTQRMRDGYFECSECGWHVHLMEYIGFGDMGAFEPKYCPECGREILRRANGAERRASDNQ